MSSYILFLICLSISDIMPSKRSKSKERERKRKQRENRSDEQKEKENEKLKIRMLRLRVELPENVALQNIKNKHRMRKAREKRSGKGHLTDCLKAKKGMRLLKEKGRVLDFEWRGERNLTEEEGWESLLKKGGKEKAILEEKHPDIVERLNEKARVDREKKKEKNRDKKRLSIPR